MLTDERPQELGGAGPETPEAATNQLPGQPAATHSGDRGDYSRRDTEMFNHLNNSC